MAPEAPSNDRGGAGGAAGVPALVLPSFGISIGGISCARPGWRGRCGDGEAESESAASGLGQAARRPTPHALLFLCERQLSVLPFFHTDDFCLAGWASVFFL